jgi:hypothetical protein
MNMLDVEILTGNNAAKRVFLPRIKNENICKFRSSLCA